MVANPWTRSGLRAQFDATERDALSLTQGLTDAQGRWRTHPQAWSVAECLDHLAISNRVYLRAMRAAASRMPATSAVGEETARPGWLGRWMVWALEPPVRRMLKTRAPASIRPREAPQLHEALQELLASHREIVRFLEEYGQVDWRRVRFASPFLPALRLSVADGLQVMAAHERRHLWQAGRVRACARLEAAKRSQPAMDSRKRTEAANPASTSSGSTVSSG